MEKVRISSLFVVVLHICLVSGSVLGDAPTEGLISHWKLDEGAGDVAYDSVGGNDGWLVSSPVWTGGIIDGALDFDGVDDYVDVGDPIDGSLDFGASDSFSISAWFKTAKNGQVVYKQTCTGVGGIYHEGYRIRIYPEKLYFAIEDTGDNLSQVFGNTIITDDQWHHMVAVRDTGTDKLYLYLDGSPDAAPVTDNTTGTLATSRSFEIGRSDLTFSPGLSFFTGKIDDVRIYDRALSAEEVREIYLEGAGPIAHWKFDEGEGTIAYDSAGDNDGTLVNGPVWTSGIIGGALDFDGDGDYVLVNNAMLGSSPTGNLTLSAWAKSTISSSEKDYIVQQGEPYSSSEPYGKTSYIELYWNTTNFVFSSRPTNYGTPKKVFSNTKQANTWYHVVGVVNTTGDMILYVNGVQEGTPTAIASLSGHTRFLIGTEGTDTGSAVFQCFFNGKIDDVRVYDRALSEEEIQELYLEGLTVVAVDIKPESCPNPLNVSGRGVLPVAILGANNLDVNTIDVASIRLAGVDPIRSAYEDVAGPVSDGNECECTEEDADGYIDLTLKFKTPEIVEALVNIYGDLIEGDELALSLTGVLTDGTPIEGTDCVRIVGKVPRALAAKRSDINEDGMVNMSDFGMMAEYWLEQTTFEY